MRGIKLKLVIPVILLISAVLLFNILYKAEKPKAGNPTKAINWGMGSWYVNGTYNWTGMTQDLDLMKQAGITTVRFSLGDHTQRTCTSAAFYTRVLNELEKRGLDGLADISIPNRLTTTATQSELDYYANWLRTMVTCYKDKLQNYEVWNEVNSHLFWNINERTTDDAAYAQSVGYYIAYLKTSYETIKEIDPTANVILGGITQNWNITLADGRQTGSMTRFMTEFIRQGGYLYIDSWGFHPYIDYDPARTYSYNGYTGCGATSVQRIDEFKAFIYGNSIPLAHRSKPLWLTEIGYTSTADEYPGNTKGSESVKAACITKTWEYYKASGITTPIVYFDFSNDNLLTTRQEGYSLVPSNKSTNQYVLNLSYHAYKNLWPATPISTPTRTPTTAPTRTPILAPPTPTFTPALPTHTPTLTPTAVPTSRPTSPPATPTSSPFYRPGDINRDGSVNIIDIGIIIDNYSNSVPPSSPTDLNNDGVINILDLGIVIDNYNA